MPVAYFVLLVTLNLNTIVQENRWINARFM